MSSTQKTNPSQGTKFTSDPASKHASNPENAGPITKDSLAAESLRSDGSFASGNPAGISSVGSENNTFNIKSDNARILHGGKEETRDEGMIGRADKDVKSKAGQTGTTGGGKQAQYSFNDESRDSRGESAIDDLKNAGSRGSSHTAGSTGRSTGRSGNTETAGARGSAHTAGSTGGSGSTGTVGRGGEDVDWSKIPNETRPVTDIGSEDDPARAGEQHFIKSATRQGGMTSGRQAEAGNPYSALNSEEQS